MAEAVKTIFISGVGTISLVKNSRARNMSLYVKDSSSIRVTVPRGFNFLDAEQFVHQKMVWLKKVLEKQKQREKKQTVFDINTEFSTREHKLLLNPENRKNINIRVVNGIIKVSFPALAGVQHPLVQKCIKKGIEEAWRIEARRYLPQRVDELAQRSGFTFRQVTIRNSRTRWGSCARNNNISLSLHMIRLPQHLIDYIILHELVHTIHKDHGEGFHTMLRRLIPQETQFSRELLKYDISII
jgi:predicted metal-dependent hydrolase